MSLILQNVNEEGIDKILANTPGDPKRGQAMDVLMAPYTPLWRRQQAQGNRALPVPGMTARAAEALVQAAEGKLIPHADWLRFVRIWDRIVVSAANEQPA